MIKSFLDDNFLLQNSTAERLYHNYAKSQPIIDYHNHLPPDEIANNKKFSTITEVWLKGDHYKWRAMRANGIDEKLSQAMQVIPTNFQNGRKPYLTLCVIHCSIGRI